MAEYSGSKWGDQKIGTAGGLVTWSLAGGGLAGVRSAFQLDPGGSDKTAAVEKIGRYDVATALQEAFSNWARFADITFVQVADSGRTFGLDNSVDIRIAFGDVDGRSSILGLGYTPGNHPLNGDILFDTGDLGLFGNRDAFISVAAHEIGHAIGLDHSHARNSLMFATFTGFEGPQQDDIAGIRNIYGPNERFPNSSLKLTDGVSELRIEQRVDGLRIFGNSDDNIIRGGNGREQVAGGNGDDRISGGRGNDTLRGDQGDDRLSGGAGDDLLNGLTDNDRLSGGGGDDRLLGRQGADVLKGGRGADTLGGGADTDRLLGGGGSDRMLGGAGNDIVRGGSGNDTLTGSKGNDRLLGDQGTDVLRGGVGDDNIRGGRDYDRLVGGAGDDTLHGGLGRDTFVFERKFGTDSVLDFRAGFDQLEIRNANGLSDLFLTNSEAGVLVEVDGGGAILLSSVERSELSASDFIF